MDTPLWVERNFLKISDWVSKFLPQKKPTPEKINSCKIICHRGHHDNLKVFENTLGAFKAAQELGAWGIEFDIRWSKDKIPVVIHDQNTLRLFGVERNINELTLKEIRESFPLIPTFKEVVDTFSKKLHLMIELKEMEVEGLEETLKDLEPINDFHFLSLKPEILDSIRFCDKRALIPVAIANTNFLSKVSLDKDWGGLCGHYFLLTDTFIKRHHDMKKSVGTGHVASKNCLYREINRGVDWIFTNNLKDLIP
jgi:glycerophosphoryl diester phosphodiesterase